MRALLYILILIFCVALAVGAVFSLSLSGNNADINVYASTSNTVSVGELTYTGYESRTDGKAFDPDNLKDLYSKLSGKAGAAYSDVAALGTKTAADIRTANGGKDVLVTFAGLQWTVTYLTQAGGNVILDLWLADSTDTSTWTDGWHNTNSNTWTYPANLYGTSYIRAVTLNNGGLYTYAVANGGTTTSTVNASSQSDVATTVATQSSTHKFAKFTVSTVSGSLTNYLLTPAQALYQASERGSVLSVCVGDCSNEGYGTGASIASGYNYESNAYYDVWKNDKLWLPSLTEVGTNGSNGIWSCSFNQTSNSIETWLRTAKHDTPAGLPGPTGETVHSVPTGGGYNHSYKSVYAPLAVRPAMHLNLTAAEAGKIVPLASPQGVTLTTTFNGNNLLSPVDSVITSESWYDASMMNLSCTQTVRNVGTYTITAALSSFATANGMEWAIAGSTATTTANQTFTLKVTQIPISYTLAKKVTADVYGDTDAGVVVATYPTSSVQSADVGTVHGPDLEIYYKSTDGYGYGTGADDTSGKGYGNPTAPTEAGAYIATAIDKNAATSNYAMSGSTFTFSIKPKQIKKPTSSPAYTYDGTKKSFTVNNYDPTYMDYGVTSGGTYSPGALPTGMTKGAGARVFEATNAAKYDIEFRLKATASGVVRNYEWDDGTNGILKLTYEIKPKMLEFDFASPGSSWTVATTDTGAITYTYKSGADPISGETPHLQFYYYFQSDGAGSKQLKPEGVPLNIEDVTDSSGVRSTGVYVTGLQFAKDSSGLDYPVNLNYTLGTSAEISSLILTAGVAGIDGITLSYRDSTMGATDPLKALPTGSGALNYAIDGSGNVVAYFPQLDFAGTVFEMTGTPTYLCAVDGSTPLFADGVTKAGVVTVTVDIAIKAGDQATNKMPTTYAGTKFKSFTYIDNYHATVVFDYTIGKMDINTAGFKLQYSYDQTTWKDFATASNQVEYANATIYVRIDPNTLKPASAGISVMFGTSTYASGKNKNTYTAAANFTLTDNDNFTISPATYNWEITNKQINVTTWAPGDFNISGVDHIGEILVINGHNAAYTSGAIEYVYTWSDMSGNSGSGVGESELDKIFTLASPTNQVTVTATVQLAASAIGSYDLLGSVLTSPTFYVGAAKTIADITNAGSAEYGSVDESALGVKVEAGGADLPATNPATGALLYEVYLHDYDGVSVDNISGNGYGLVSGIDYGKLNAGKYVIEVRFTSAGTTDYAPRGARQLFEITPKKVVVPLLTEELTFNGAYIDVTDYLDGNYDSAIMSVVSGYTNKNAGNYTVTFVLTNPNYIWVEPAAPTAAAASATVFARVSRLFAGVAIDNSTLTATLDWRIKKIVLGGTWNLGSKEGASIDALDGYADMIASNGLDVAIAYRYFDTNGNLIEEPVLTSGDKYLVEAYLTGADAANFEFSDGVDADKIITARQEYTVPTSLLDSMVSFLGANWWWIAIAAAALVLLILFIILAVRHSKKKAARLKAEAEAREKEETRREKKEREDEERRRREELEEKRRAEEEERRRREEEREERRLEREARMQSYAMPQMPVMPQMQAPVQSAPASAPANNDAIMASIRAEFDKLRAEQNASKMELELAKMRIEQQAAKEINNARMEAEFAKLRAEQGQPYNPNVQNGANVLGGLLVAALRKYASDAQGMPIMPPEEKLALPESNIVSGVSGVNNVVPGAITTTTTTTTVDASGRGEEKPATAVVENIPEAEGLFNRRGRKKSDGYDPDNFYNFFDEQDKKDK